MWTLCVLSPVLVSFLSETVQNRPNPVSKPVGVLPGDQRDDADREARGHPDLVGVKRRKSKLRCGSVWRLDELKELPNGRNQGFGKAGEREPANVWGMPRAGYGSENHGSTTVRYVDQLVSSVRTCSSRMLSPPEIAISGQLRWEATERWRSQQLVVFHL